MKLRLSDLQNYAESKQKIEDFLSTNKVIKLIANYDSVIIEAFSVKELIEKMHNKLKEITLTNKDELFNEEGNLITYVAVRNPENKRIEIKKVFIFIKEVEKEGFKND